MARFRDRAAFFGKNKGTSSEPNARQRRKIQRKYLQEEHERYQKAQEEKKRQKGKEAVKEKQDKRIVILPKEPKQQINQPSQPLLDLAVDDEEYQEFLHNERKQVLISEIRHLEKQIKEKKERGKSKRLLKVVPKGILALQW